MRVGSLIDMSAHLAFGDAAATASDKLLAALRRESGQKPERVKASPLPAAARPSAPGRENYPALKIMGEVCDKYGISLADIRCSVRSGKFVRARQECYFRLRTERRLSLSQIGKFCGRADHTSVLYGIRMHESRLSGQPYQRSRTTQYGCESMPRSEVERLAARVTHYMQVRDFGWTWLQPAAPRLCLKRVFDRQDIHGRIADYFAARFPRQGDCG
jgi:DnaA-like protein